ncbi:MAG: hypothetical protein LBI20_01610 [Holosporales bacterium]|jgi:hypothetical protein|nr:hypothetical protein [Holosporales bacterium]
MSFLTSKLRHIFVGGTLALGTVISNGYSADEDWGFGVELERAQAQHAAVVTCARSFLRYLALMTDPPGTQLVSGQDPLNPPLTIAMALWSMVANFVSPEDWVKEMLKTPEGVALLGQVPVEIIMRIVKGWGLEFTVAAFMGILQGAGLFRPDAIGTWVGEGEGQPRSQAEPAIVWPGPLSPIEIGSPLGDPPGDAVRGLVDHLPGSPIMLSPL